MGRLGNGRGLRRCSGRECPATSPRVEGIWKLMVCSRIRSLKTKPIQVIKFRPHVWSKAAGLGFLMWCGMLRDWPKAACGYPRFCSSWLPHVVWSWWLLRTSCPMSAAPDIDDCQNAQYSTLAVVRNEPLYVFYLATITNIATTFLVQ